MAPSPSRARAPLAAALLALPLVLATGCAASPTPRASSTTPPSAHSTAPPTRAPADEARAAARDFARFARENRSEVRFAPTVRYLVAGADVALLDAASARRPGAWLGCPGGTHHHEGRDCPVSPLASLRRARELGASIRVEEGTPRVVGCTRVRPLDRRHVVTLRPDAGHRSCFDDLAVMVHLDDRDRVEVVDLVLSGP